VPSITADKIIIHFQKASTADPWVSLDKNFNISFFIAIRLVLIIFRITFHFDPLTFSWDQLPPIIKT
jgi:hypothetical protein